MHKGIRMKRVTHIHLIERWKASLMERFHCPTPIPNPISIPILVK